MEYDSCDSYESCDSYDEDDNPITDNFQDHIRSIVSDMTDLDLANIFPKFRRLFVCKNNALRILSATFTDLVYLNCTRCNIEQIPKELRSLEELRCSENLISSIPTTLTRLRVLECTHNYSLKVISDLPSLEILNCTNSPIYMLKNLPKLRILDCSMTKLTTIPEEFVMLENLKCRYTEITYLSSKFTRLISLDCSWTSISVLPNTLIKMKDFTFYHCQSIRTSQPLKIPANFLNLVSLECNKGCVHKPLPKTFEQLTHCSMEPFISEYKLGVDKYKSFLKIMVRHLVYLSNGNDDVKDLIISFI